MKLNQITEKEKVSAHYPLRVVDNANTNKQLKSAPSFGFHTRPSDTSGSLVYRHFECPPRATSLKPGHGGLSTVIIDSLDKARYPSLSGFHIVTVSTTINPITRCVAGIQARVELQWDGRADGRYYWPWLAATWRQLAVFG